VSALRRMLVWRYIEQQYRVRCVCGWTTEWWDDQSLADEAWLRHKREAHR
jgi:hypothetical protein